MTKMANAFANIQKASEKVEELATQILTAAQDAKALTLEAFNELVTEGYRANNWSQQVGRPSDDSTLQPAPSTIRFYVSTMRRMYREGLDVMGFKVMWEVRRAVRAKRQPVHASRDDLSRRDKSALRGVKLTNSKEPIGSLWHDMIYYWEVMSEGDRKWFDQKLETLRIQAMKKVTADMAEAA